MAKTKAYSVRRAFAARHKDSGDEVWVTRENEHLIPDMLSTARIKDYVDSGALEEYETDGPALTAVSEAAKPPIKTGKS
jgi:hypothetical protein